MLDALDDALRAGLVRELPGTERLAFAHALVRDALVGQLSAARRAYLHRRIAEVLAERAESAPEQWLAPLAHHALAGAGADPEPALAYALEAGRQAVERLAWEDAVELLERAEGLARSRAAPGRLAEVLVALGDARLRAGETDRARIAFEEAARLAREEPRDDLLARAALGAAGLGVTIVAVDEPLVALLEEALERLQPDQAALRVRLLSRLAIALAYAPAEARRRALVEEAVAAARTLADPGALAVALTASHVVHWAPEHLSARLAAADELVALGERTGDPEIELHGRHWRVVDLLEHGDVASAADEIQVYDRLAAEARLPAFSWYVPAWRAALSGYRGELAAARRLAHEAHAQATRVRDDNADPVLTANHYTLHVVEETLQEFDLGYLRARIQSPAGRSYRAGLALCLAELGDDDAARALLDEAAGRGPRAHAARRQPPDRPRPARRGVRRRRPRRVRRRGRPAAGAVRRPHGRARAGNRARRLSRTAAWPRPGGGRTNGRSDRRSRGRDLGRSRTRRDPVRRARPARPRRDLARPRRSRRRHAGGCAARGGSRNGGPARPRRAGPPRTRAARVRYGRASSTRLNGVSAARRTEAKPAFSSTPRSAASPACAPSAGVPGPPSAIACGTQMSAEPA